MVRTLLVFLLVSIFSFTYAQEETRLAAKGGFNLTSLTGTEKASMRFSVNFGGKINIYLKDKMSIQPEMQVSWQGARFKQDDGSKVKANLTFLNIPVVYKYFFNPKICAYGGFQMGILLSGKTKYDGEKENVRSDLHSMDFGMVLGGEYFVDPDISIELRMIKGFKNMIDDPYTYGDQKWRNLGFQLGGNYYF